jgi:hypothetical protein
MFYCCCPPCYCGVPGVVGVPAVAFVPAVAGVLGVAEVLAIAVASIPAERGVFILAGVFTYCTVKLKCTLYIYDIMTRIRLSDYYRTVAFLWNFFISREAATAERRYEKERQSVNLNAYSCI